MIFTRNHSQLVKIVLLFILLSKQISAQNNGSINGLLLHNNAPVEFVNVLLYNVSDTTKTVAIAVTDSTGKFNFDKLLYNNYQVKFQMLGYKTTKVNTTINEANNIIQLPNIILTSDSKLLKGVEVVSHKDLIKKTAQGFVIDATTNLAQAGGTATDILKNTPTVVVDAEGGITIRGKAPLILINGRNSKLANTDRIPASSIESIEIINNPTAQYGADAEGGIINIKLKKNTEKGTNGSVGIGAGYGAHPRGSSSFIINHTTKKLNIGLAYDNRIAERTRKIQANRTNFYLPEQYYFLQNRLDNRMERTQNLKLNVDYTLNPNNNLSFEAIANTEGQDNNETLTSTVIKQSNDFNSKNKRQSIELGKEKIAEGAIIYNHQFADTRHTLASSINTSFEKDNENTNITTQSLAENNNSLGNNFYQKTSNAQLSNVSSFKIDYAQPIAKKGIFETGYKAIKRFTNADFKNLYYANNDFIINPKASSIFNFNEQIHAAYLQYRSYVGNIDTAVIKYDVGLRAEQVYNNSKGANNKLIARQQYLKLFPTANIAYYLSPNNYFKFSLSRRINRPQLEQLNPFVDITDSLNPHSGNPYLKPELVNSYELGYNKNWKKTALSASIFYRSGTNSIRNYVTLQNNGVALAAPINIGNTTTYGLESILSIYPTNFWTINASASMYQLNIKAQSANLQVANNVFSWYGKLVNNFDMWHGSKLQLIANYNSPIANPQGTKVAIYYLDLGFQQKIMQGKGGLGIVVTDVFNTQGNGFNLATNNFTYNRKFKIDSRAIIITFAYTFGTKFKQEMIENKFSND
jgi:outer membrane receptor protein involved in Fe transport